MIGFFTDGSRPIVPLIKAYEELTSPSANLAAIPLFTLTGFLLAEGKSSERLLRALRALFGWAPGGTAVAAATLCAFFTLFTGGSGVTILALGGLLLPALLKEGYRERFSIGLLTASGSLGLLFPLSVPLILYGIVAQNVAIEDLFIGGLFPGVLMLALLAALGVREAVRSGVKHAPFNIREVAAGLWEAKWEMLLPVVVLWALLGGYATTSESAAIAALYALIVQRFIHRDLPSFKDVVRVAGDCVALVGGVLIILSVAVGLTNYLVNAQVPTQLIEWTQAHIESALAVPARAERVPAARRHGDGHLLGDRRRRAADPAARRRLRHRLRPPRRHLHREPRARLSASAARPEPAARLRTASRNRSSRSRGRRCRCSASSPSACCSSPTCPWLTEGLLRWMGRL